MKKPATDHTAAYMSRGANNNNSKNAPKGVTFAESQTSKPGHTGLGMQQHQRKMNKHGSRYNSPHEHLEPTEAIFHKIGR